ncbi:MAG: DNA/RNA non-specific endonuclease [Anaerolineae bacterium]|nr:DNA/RNA non-specific endonuclease [Promineifilum sp.]MCW5847817.1 DNA/RNA non-specific endonuclease [Anaerolineae bacterium]
MDSQQHDQNAEDRFQARRAQRAAQLDKAAKGIVDFTDMIRRDARRAMLHPNDGLGLERILGVSDLLEVNFLDIGRRAGRAVGRVQIRDATGRVRGFGTGFVVSPHLLLTNNHVLPSADSARRSLVDFEYEDDENFNPRTPVMFGMEPDLFFLTNERLDYAIVALRPTSVDGATPLSDFGFLPLSANKGKILIDEYVAVIQHPGGAPKKIALRNNKLVDLFDDFLHYTTDTDRGASGSPVFNDQWQVVGLHHAGVRQRDEQGRILAVDGTVWTPAMGEERIAYIANEGVRVSSILADLSTVAANGLSADQIVLLDELLAEPSRPTPPAGAVTPLLTAERDPEIFLKVKGYERDFLGPVVELPRLSAAQSADAAPRLDGRGHVLDYVHFSLVMSQSRRMAYYTAVNIDGRQLKTIKRDRDVWYFDPRLAREHQAGEDLYDRNDLDRGHLVRRNDPVWGRPASTANEDTFHFTNCAPQHMQLNRRTWLGLEDYILNNADNFNLKVSVFTGPVFRADDMLYRGQYQLPAEFWKVVIMRRKDRSLSATAYLQTQKNLLEDLEFAYGAYRTYQVPVSRIEAITGLDFGPLRDHDPLAVIESVSPALVIGDAADIRL